MQIEHHHCFGRERIIALLRECDFDVVDFAVPNRNGAEMELYAVRKPFRPGHALRNADALCMERYGGMGDVLMALGAAKALKSLSGRPVILVTAPALQGLAESCPHVDHVVGDLSALGSRYANIKHVNLSPVAFGISRLHQIDAYLEEFGVSADAAMKDIELVPDQPAAEAVERMLASWPARIAGRARILLHVGQGDANRSWPRERWTALAATLIGLEHQVIVIGSTGDPQKPATSLAVEGVLSAVDALSAAGTVALMRQADIFVSADSGPVQLAGATDIGIVGLYSSVAGSSRLPFRHGVAAWRAEAVKPSCPLHPCYQQMHNNEVMAPFMAKLQNQSLQVNELFANWCPDGGSFACMTQQITVPMVLDAIGRLAAPPN
jgi:ADP-heptose:LPS heptosyltransferase